MIKACIFDMDGTLVNTLFCMAYFGNEALKKMGFPPVETEKYRYMVGDGVDRLMRRMLQNSIGQYQEEDAKKLRKIYDDMYNRNHLYLVQNYNGIPELLLKLKTLGIKLAVFSNKPHNLVCMTIDSLFPSGTFDVCYGQRPSVPLKPAPDGALLIAQELNVSPKECLYIGDTNTDMQTGNSAGMDTVGVLWGFRNEQELRENHAKYIVSQAEDIYRIVFHTHNTANLGHV